MIYTFRCSQGHRREVSAPISEGPPRQVNCRDCFGKMERDWQADAPMIDTSACRDANEVAEPHRVVSRYDRGTPAQVERQFKKAHENRRKEIRDAGGQKGSFRQTHSVPAHLYHGKIRETGDKSYWNDPKNLAKHKDCRVE